MKKFTLLAFFTFVFPASASGLPEEVVSTCTTNEAIYNTTDLRGAPNLTLSEKRNAVRRALGASSSDPDFNTHMFKGQWFLEYETDDAIYAGYKVRSHYLNTAIFFTDSGVSTLICNSTNLKQKKRSIHKKAPLWKGTLDGNIRIELGKQTSKTKSNSDLVQSLDALRANGIVTTEEYEDLSKRINELPSNE